MDRGPAGLKSGCSGIGRGWRGSEWVVNSEIGLSNRFPATPTNASGQRRLDGTKKVTPACSACTLVKRPASNRLMGRCRHSMHSIMTG